MSARANKQCPIMFCHALSSSSAQSRTFYCFIHRSVVVSVIVNYCAVIIHLKYIFIMNISVLKTWLKPLASMYIFVRLSLALVSFFFLLLSISCIYIVRSFACVIQPKHTIAEWTDKTREMKNSIFSTHNSGFSSNFIYFHTHFVVCWLLFFCFYSSTRFFSLSSFLNLIRWLARVFYCLAVVE